MGLAATRSGRSVTAPTRSSLADEAWALLRELLFAERRRFLDTASEFELHPAQAGALMQLDRESGSPMHEIAAHLACDSSNVTGIVDRLEALFLGGQTLDSGRRPCHPCAHRVADLEPERCRHDVLDAAVPLARTPGHEPTRLEPVDDTRHVGAVAREVCGDLVHRRARLLVELHQRTGLRRMQLELRGGVEEAPTLGEQKLTQQRPCLVRG